MERFNIYSFINELEADVINEINKGNIQSSDDYYTFIGEMIDSECTYYSHCFDICDELNAHDFTAFDPIPMTIRDLAIAALELYTFESLDVNKFDELIETINA